MAGTRDVKRLEAAGFDALKAEYPAVWREVGERLVAASERRSPEALAAFVEQAARAAEPWREKVRASHGNPQVVAAALPHLAAARLARLAVDQLLLVAATGRTGGPGGELRLGRLSAAVVDRLLFARGLERKPVSMAAFRLLWPLVPAADRRLLVPLVQRRGMWCFYSRALVRELASLAAGRPVLEIAAGDGTLSRFLADEGVTVTATDDGSWTKEGLPANVERLDAAAALARHPAPVVLCSFPPPGNGFERKVFQAPHVRLYVVVTSRHRHAAGDWEAYEDAARPSTGSGRAEPGFERVVDERLSRLVLPPEIDPVVLVFERKG